MELRQYQKEADLAIDLAWAAGNRNVLYVLPCGGGKTVVFAKKIFDHKGASCAIAHRQELVGQMAMALARFGVKHRIIAPQPVIHAIIQMQTMELGRDFYDPAARCAVAGVDTIVKRADQLGAWMKQVTLVVQDEGHHQLASNKWGTAYNLFPNAKGLLVTATPERADGKGLGRHADGLADVMIVGPGMRQLITDGMLTDYRVFCPPSDADFTQVAVAADGDYNRKQLATVTKKSSILGDVVSHYLKIAPGKLGITFAPDIETAVTICQGFNSAGVPAEVVTATTPIPVRQEIMRRFKRREILQLVNVDLFGEGFDLPAIEVVSMARATQSYSLYVQQFCRALRLLLGKDFGIIIDHVGNVLRHGLPDKFRAWTLDRRERRAKGEKDPDMIPMRVCLNPICMAPFERILTECPFCGTVPVPAGRSTPELVDGDLHELSPEVLMQMRGAVAKIDEHPDSVKRWMLKAGHSHAAAGGAANRQREKQEAQAALREALGIYGAFRRAAGEPDRVSYRRFFHSFGIDILSAQALPRAEAEALTAKVNNYLGRIAA